MKIFVIGSLSVEDSIKSVADLYSTLGADVKYVKKQPDKSLEYLIKEAFERISEADMIVAVPKPDGTFGEGTTYELAFAKHLGKITWKYTVDEVYALARNSISTKQTVRRKIIAVDFDGTLCEDCYPNIGAPNNGLIRYLKEQQKAGAKIILWTCRTGALLSSAVIWLVYGQELYVDAINENLPEVIEEMGGDTRKIFADEYIDDRNTWF